MTDEQLFQQCKKYGAAALEARRTFAGLLPEVYRRKLYEKKGFESIFVFAAKLAGMSQEQVQRVLQLERKFENKPTLRQALVSGKVSMNKLAKVASIATPENEEELAQMSQLLSTRALETLVRDEKTVHVNTDLQQSLPNVNLLGHLSPELQKNLIERLEKGIDINDLLTELLQKHDLELAQEKEQLSAEAKPVSSRYISVKVLRQVRKEHGTKCSIRTCERQAEEIHHTQRFSLARTHDPKYLAPLCKNHHQIAHSIDEQYHMKRRF